MDKEIYEEILHHLPQGILLFTTGGEIIYSNRAFAHALGYEVPDLLQLSISVFQPDQNAPPRDAQILAACQSDHAWQGEVTYRTRSGTPLRLHLALSVLTPDKGSLFLGIHTVLEPSPSAPKTSSQELLEEVVKRVRIISHDINNPLTTLLGNVELALMQIPEDDPLYKRLSTIFKQSERIRETVVRLQEIKNLAQSQ